MRVWKSVRLAVLVLPHAVAGCAGMSPVVDNIIMDPTYFDTLNCRDLVTQLQGANARVNELITLMQKSSGGSGGTFVNALAYQTDYAKARATQKYAEESARQKGCDLSKVSVKAPEPTPPPGAGKLPPPN